MANLQLREYRKQRLLSQEELAELVGVQPLAVRRWEAGQQPQPLHLRQLCQILEATPAELGFTSEAPRALQTIGLNPLDLPDLDEVEAATWRLRRSYSTTPPAELLVRLNDRLVQIRELLNRGRPQWRKELLGHAGWLVLLRSTVLVDLRHFEAAQSTVHAARALAREVRDANLEAWSWETEAWMTATDGREYDARELATEGIRLAPKGSFGLVSATMQRARIHGGLGRAADALADVRAGTRAMAQTSEVLWPDDHYSIDPSKALYYVSGTMAALHRPLEAIEHAAEVVRQNEDPNTPNYWPMRIANARMEWAAALADLGEEDEAYAMGRQSLADQLWFRPDTERRGRMLLSRLRDPRLHSQFLEELYERLRQEELLRAG